MNEKTENKKLVYLLLGVIILLELLWTGYVFIFEKGGCHSDEIWTYGLSNSYYQPFVYMESGIHIDDLKEENLINENEWISGDVLRKYITVQEGEGFSYGSVWSNQTYDHHPPLFYLLLHTVCSFFPDTFSWGFGFFLNCCFLIVTQIFLFKTARHILKDDRYGLVVCLFYAAGHAALNTFTFIRQYSLLTMLGIMLVYFTSKLYTELSLKKRLAPILIVSFAMFMTHYYGIIFAGALTACMCIYLACRKQITKMLIYGFSMLGCLGLFFAVYPAALSHMFNYSQFTTKVFGFFPQLKKLINYITYNQLGFGISIYESSFWRIFPVVLLAAVIVIVPLCFLLRKEKWFISFKESVFRQPKRFWRWLKKADYMPLILLAVSFVILCVVDHETDLFWMKKFSMRYIFCIFPLICISAVSFAKAFIGAIPFIKRYALPVITAAVVIITGKINIFHDNWFLFENYPKGINVSELTAGKNCVIVLLDSSDWTLTCVCDTFIDAKNIYAVTSDRLAEQIDNIKALGEPIDYILTPGASLTPEEDQKIKDWGYVSGFEEDKMITSGTTEGIITEFKDDISKLCEGQSRELKGYIDAMNNKLYLFELKQQGS